MSGCAVRGGDGVWRSIDGLPADTNVSTPAGQKRLEDARNNSRICEARIVIKNEEAYPIKVVVTSFLKRNDDSWRPTEEFLTIPSGEARPIDVNLPSSRPATISRIIRDRLRVQQTDIPVGKWCESFYGGDGNRYLDGYIYGRNEFGVPVFKEGIVTR